ncbi:hypothetical protein B0H21DRAFT_215101 [Amylocystis lapponica]|nr:hypothetical protein B0H21DRAFT_215101 [Amylocystis lapponica]
MSHQPQASASGAAQAALSTPRRTRPTTSAAAGAAQVTPSPNRKKPRCIHCSQPKEGHPRSGCPYVDPPIPPSEPPAPRRRSGLQQITHSLSAVQLDEPAAASGKARKVTFDLPTSANRADESDDGSDAEAHASISHWRASVVSPGEPESPSTPPQSHAGPDAGLQLRVAKPVRLGRTMSEADRQQFLDYLAFTAKASDSVHLVRLGADQIRENQEEAERLGFHGRVLAPREDWPNQEDRLLVLGKSEKAVDMLFGSISARARAKGRLPVLVMAAFVGALGTLGVLAFS